MPPLPDNKGKKAPCLRFKYRGDGDRTGDCCRACSPPPTTHTASAPHPLYCHLCPHPPVCPAQAPAPVWTRARSTWSLCPQPNNAVAATTIITVVWLDQRDHVPGVASSMGPKPNPEPQRVSSSSIGKGWGAGAKTYRHRRSGEQMVDGTGIREQRADVKLPHCLPPTICPLLLLALLQQWRVNLRQPPIPMIRFYIWKMITKL